MAEIWTVHIPNAGNGIPASTNLLGGPVLGVHNDFVYALWRKGWDKSRLLIEDLLASITTVEGTTE